MLRYTGLACLALLLAACSPQGESDAPAETPAPAASTTPAQPPPPPIEKPLEIGSQDARDDLYCAGLIFAVHPEPLDAVVPVEHAQILKIQGLALGLSLEGASKLIDQGAALPLQTGDVAAAWGDLAYDDYVAGKTKLPLDGCMERARAAAAAYADQ